MITLQSITKQYKVGDRTVKAINDVSLSFCDKEFVAILGPSGCGKTTLLNIIGGLDNATSGKLIIDDEDTSQYSSHDWDSYRNNQVGFVFQSFHLIKHLSVLKNVEISLSLSGVSKRKKKEMAYDALRQVGLENHANKKPNQLSGGEAQRVAIARAIVNDPKIILADEATGALDSETSTQIMDILKRLSHDRLVIMVTHNEDLANKYATRIIKLFDGVVKSDIASEVNDTTVVAKPKAKKKVTMSFLTALILSFKNLKCKWPRTLLTVLAGSIGIIGVCLVMAVSNGVSIYMDEVQKVALSNNPITISSRTTVSQDGSGIGNLPAFPDTDEVIITRPISIYEHISLVDENFVNYINEMPKELYSVISYQRSAPMNIIHKSTGGYNKVYTSNFVEMTDDLDFVSEQYDVLRGSLPTNEYEVAIVVDRYNCLSASLLDNIGLEYENITSYTYEELMNIQMKLIGNDDYYVKQDDRYYVRGSSYYDDLFENTNHQLKVSGIVRMKQAADNPLYNSCILFSPRLTDFIVDSANKSQIVIEQKAFGLDKNVTTGLPYEDLSSISSTTTKEYQYESKLTSLGANASVTSVRIYTTKFHDRLAVESYVKQYSDYNKLSNISYYDYMKNISEQLSTFIQILTKALVIFASISLLVSAIMIAIITYVSVLERTSEIGVLRSVGARKIDIARIFTAESVLIGFASGLLGLVGSFVLSKPINQLVVNIIKENTVLTHNIDTVNLVAFSWLNLLLLLVGSVVITVMAGFIPSIIAARKSPIAALRSEN